MKEPTRIGHAIVRKIIDSGIAAALGRKGRTALVVYNALLQYTNTAVAIEKVLKLRNRRWIVSTLNQTWYAKLSGFKRETVIEALKILRRLRWCRMKKAGNRRVYVVGRRRTLFAWHSLDELTRGIPNSFAHADKRIEAMRKELALILSD